MPEQRPRPAWQPALRAGLRASLLALPFVAAGRATWTRGWIFIGLIAATMAVNIVVIRRKNPALLRARLENPAGTKRFDKIYAAVSGAAALALFVVAGLDARFGWSAAGYAWLYAGVALHAAGMIPATAAMAVNPFLERTVRIQSERGHVAVTSGPYRFVRHPMYAGFMLAMPGWPLVLGSWWSYLPMGVMMVALVVRTALEDKTLRRELPGYEDFCRRTRYRLVPGAW